MSLTMAQKVHLFRGALSAPNALDDLKIVVDRMKASEDKELQTIVCYKLYLYIGISKEWKSKA